MNELTGTLQGDAGRSELFYRQWSPDLPAPPEAAADRGQLPVLVVCHGYGEHSGRYAETAEYFTRLGHDVYAPDFRGHGKSPGERGYVKSLEEYAEDLNSFMKFGPVGDAGSIVLIGHSVGAAVALLYAGRYAGRAAAQSAVGNGRLKGLVLSGTALRLAVEAGTFLRLVVRFLACAAPRLKAAPGVADLVSRDKTVVETYKNDPLVYNEKTKAGMAAVLMDAEKEIAPVLPLIEYPVLIMHGSEDKIIEPESSRVVYRNVLSGDKTLKFYEGLYHEIYQEPEKDTVLRDVAGWLRERGLTK